MKVKEIIESYSWDHTLMKLEPKRETDLAWHHSIADKPQEPRYAVVNKQGKAVRTDLSHKAALYLKDRPDLLKQHGALRIIKI